MTEVGIENINFQQEQNSMYIEYNGTQKKYQKVSQIFENSNFLSECETVLKKMLYFSHDRPFSSDCRIN